VLSNTLNTPRKTFKKVLSKLAAQTRFRAIKNAPLNMCKQLTSQFSAYGGKSRNLD